MVAIVSATDKIQIQKRTIVYSPIYVNGMKADTNKTGSYVLFYIFTKTPDLTVQIAPKSCIVESLDRIGKEYDFTFVKIGNFSNGAPSRHSSNKGDLIKNDGNRSPAARHAQDTLIKHPDLYCHFIMVVLSPDTVEKHLEKALEGIVSAIGNKQERILAAPGKWNTPIQLVPSAVISKKLSERIITQIGKKP